MSDLYVFADEAGELAFQAKSSSRYFILTTLTVSDCPVGDALLNLRRQLAWEGVETHPSFHATEELQPVRDRVFSVLQQHEFRIDATIFEKAKANPNVRQSADRFYRFAWDYHLRYLAQRAIPSATSRLLLVPATIAERKHKQELFTTAVRTVVSEIPLAAPPQLAFWMGRSDPCLWAVDYCCWAIQRKWERTWHGNPDDRSHRLIAPKIHSEFDIFRRSTTLYY